MATAAALFVASAVLALAHADVAHSVTNTAADGLQYSVKLPGEGVLVEWSINGNLSGCLPNGAHDGGSNHCPGATSATFRVTGLQPS